MINQQNLWEDRKDYLRKLFFADIENLVWCFFLAGKHLEINNDGYDN